MTRRRWTTDAEIEAEREQDERNVGGCLVSAVEMSSVALLIWVLA
ncbi:MAG TPA: hypothetical protein VJS15_10100 [Allosphingosinicella sp.]|nr:hypothetical protein [Allosphingosinicella sp.]